MMVRPRAWKPTWYEGYLHGHKIGGYYVGAHQWEECEWQSSGYVEPGFTITEQDISEALEIERAQQLEDQRDDDR